jgi:hypothetical protein
LFHIVVGDIGFIRSSDRMPHRMMGQTSALWTAQDSNL